jgi:hypothetical protein
VENLDQILERHGADPEAFRPFDDDGPDLLPYATLLAARREATDPALSALLGIYEWQSSPLVFLMDGDHLPRAEDLSRLRRHLAMRGDAPYLGLLRAGQLVIYRISLDADAPEKSRIPLPLGSERSLFAVLGNQRPGVTSNPRQWITNVVLRLLAESIRELKVDCEIDEQDAVSLVGRALFTRFLGDRGLLDKSLAVLGADEISHLFDNRAQVNRTCEWLDRTFNGDLLPLSRKLLRELPKRACWSLGNILRRAPGGQLSLGWEEKWENLDFAHIPVGVLSQAHEQYLREYLPIQQRNEGCYYTPRAIANLMVSGAFHALRRAGMAHQARVLDPASGAGVFLITAFRQLVAERWRHDDVRPQTRTLREILYTQITGFDINESALRFAALGLYLMSIELDDHPEPVKKLRFKKLRGKVLCKVGEHEEGALSHTLGSLGSDVDSTHSGRYDLVISNPPWTSGTKLPEWQQVLECVARIARERCPKAPPPKLPNEVLDLPFLWRAMEWAKPGSQIALALHARLLFEQGECMPEARSAVFQALDVTGIVNGAELRQTKVWPEISAPFCLLFARNQTPAPGAEIRFVSPHLEDSLNEAGGIRVDAANAETITSEQIIHRPEILKILFRGSQLDLEVYDRLSAQGLSKLGVYWQRGHVAGAVAEHPAGNGYQRLRKSSRIRKHGDGKPGVSARYLWDIDELNQAAMESVLVNADNLTPFRLERIHDPRPRELFVGPKLIVHESPPARTARIRATVADVDLVFNQSFYGYNASSHPDGKRLARYLALIVGSKCALWYALMTSGKFGFERETVEMFVVDRLPIRTFEELSSSDIEQIDGLFDALVEDDSESAWGRVDSWVASLYGLRKRDLEVISDTLKFGLPFAANRKAAQLPPTGQEIDEFCKVLSLDLGSLARRADKRITASRLDVTAVSPWNLVRISAKAATGNNSRVDWLDILRIADQSAATEVIYPVASESCLWLARLGQSRYWSRSQAHLVARRIAWEHMEVLLGGGN